MAEYPEIADLDPFELLDAEAERLYRFLTGLAGEEWEPDTRCEGWRRREIVSHVAGGDTYHTACLDDRVEELFAAAAAAGVRGFDAFNAWQIAQRADRPAAEVLDEWWKLSVDVRRRMRERGPEATMSSSVGPYPVGLMAFHVASEYATHYDDMYPPPLQADERAARTAWRKKVSRFAIAERALPLTVEDAAGGVVVRGPDWDFTFTDDDFVEAVVVRLPPEHPFPAEHREAMRALA